MQAPSVSLSSTTPLPGSAELVTGLREQGYIILRCGRDLQDALARIFVEGDRFFSLPIEVKTRSALEGEMEGYRGFAREYCDVDDRPDLCESVWLHAFNIDKARQSFDSTAMPLYEGLIAAARLFDDIVRRLTLLMEEFYWGSSNPAPQFETRFGSHLQLNYYRPSEQQRDLLLDAHEDGLLFTLLQSTAPGLEIRTRDGGFEPIETTPDELLVMPGDIAALLSGGDIQPLYHRVRNRADVLQRMSLMYFSNPNASRHRHLRPWLARPSNRDVDIMQRVIDNPVRFGLPPIPVVDDRP